MHLNSAGETANPPTEASCQHAAQSDVQIEDSNIPVILANLCNKMQRCKFYHAKLQLKSHMQIYLTSKSTMESRHIRPCESNMQIDHSNCICLCHLIAHLHVELLLAMRLAVFFTERILASETWSLPVFQLFPACVLIQQKAAVLRIFFKKEIWIESLQTYDIWPKHILEIVDWWGTVHDNMEK